MPQESAKWLACFEPMQEAGAFSLQRLFAAIYSSGFGLELIHARPLRACYRIPKKNTVPISSKRPTTPAMNRLKLLPSRFLAVSGFA
jgi:hypothetical protein